MNRIPIAFAFDSNLLFPACVCLSSLMMSADNNTYYDIFILHSYKENLDKEELNKLSQYYPNCSITYRTVGDAFDNAFEIRGITTPAYYRLLIPELIPEYDKVIYSDVDVIFRRDLSDLYQTDLGDNYIAATYDLGLNLSKDGAEYMSSVKDLQCGEYIQSGFIILNNKKILNESIIEKFKELSKRNLRYQDQDILNIVCKNKIKILPFTYNMTDQAYYYITNDLSSLADKYLNDELSKAYTISTIHYNGYKPWKSYCVNFDIWWEVYRKSLYFDPKFYFNFYYDKLDEYDRLPLIKRVKILLRYFFYKK